MEVRLRRNKENLRLGGPLEMVRLRRNKEKALRLGVPLEKARLREEMNNSMSEELLNSFSSPASVPGSLAFSGCCSRCASAWFSFCSGSSMY